MAIEQFNVKKIITKPKTKIIMTSIVATILITGMVVISIPQAFAMPEPMIRICHWDGTTWDAKKLGAMGWNGHEGHNDGNLFDYIIEGLTDEKDTSKDGDCTSRNNIVYPIEVEKTWTHTDYNWDPVCDISLGVPGFVNPADGMCYSEDTFVNNIGFRPANINNIEDDVLADSFSQDSDDKYLVRANVHPTNDEFQNTQPGAFYALTTIDVNVNVDGLTVWENYDDCTNDDPVEPELGLNLLAPADKPSRAVKIAIADSSGDVTEITDEIYDGIGGEITSIDNDSAHVDILREIPVGSTVYVLVKFQDDLKGYDTGDGFFDGMCDNNEMVSELVEEPDDVYTPDFSDLANAALRIGNDYDGDEVLNNQDNCPLDSNLDQVDADFDGAGDVCDVCEGDDFADTDNDGFLCFEDPDDDDENNPVP